jgi:hypothetical protein
MKAQFIELDIILKSESKPWIIDKSNPNIPLIKIEPHEFNLFKSGIYRSQKNKMDFNGKIFWLSTEFMNKLKIKSKNNKVDISNLGISMQEFMNKDVIDNIHFDINMDVFRPMVNKNDDIYIICSKNTKINFKPQIDKLEEKMSQIGLKVKDFYYISETFYNKNLDDIAHKKSKLILQHLIGLKSDGDKFVDDEIKKYTEITFCDDSPKSIQFCRDINLLLESMALRSSDIVRKKIQDVVKNNDNLLIIKEWTHNKANKWKEYQIEVSFSNIIKSFENFKLKN